MDEKKEREYLTLLSKVFGVPSSRISIGGYVHDEDTSIVRCSIGNISYLVALKEGYSAQVYCRVM